MLERCVLTVRGEIPSFRAMALLDSRASTNRPISSSLEDGSLLQRVLFVEAGRPAPET